MVQQKCVSTASGTLQTLNTECLLHIFELLGLQEQYAMLQLHRNFAQLILLLWHHKYAQSVNFRSVQPQYKLLSAVQQQQLLRLLATCTRCLMNLDAPMGEVLAELTRRHTFERISKIRVEAVPAVDAFGAATPEPQALDMTAWPASLPHLNSLQLQHSLVSVHALCLLSSLSELQLVCCCCGDASCDFSPIFEHLCLQHLTCVSLAPSNMQLTGISHCRTLRTLKVDAAAALLSALGEVAQLPQLQQLTVYANDVVASPGRQQHRHILATLCRTKATQITVTRLKCHFDKHFLRQLLTAHLPQLRVLGWHSHLHVDYALHKGDAIKWHTHDVRVSPTLLQYVARAQGLQELDLRWNCHVQQAFEQQIRATLHMRADGGERINVKWCKELVNVDRECKSELQPLLKLGYYELEFEKFA